MREFGEPVLRLKDPDRIIVKLVGSDLSAEAPLRHPSAPTRLRAVTVLSEAPEATGGFIEGFGYRRGAREGKVQRWLSDHEGEAELTFTRRADRIISADHSGVSGTMSGRGVPTAHYDFMLDDARERELRIIPVCPFVNKQFDRRRRDPNSDVESSSRQIPQPDRKQRRPSWPKPLPNRSAIRKQITY